MRTSLARLWLYLLMLAGQPTLLLHRGRRLGQKARRKRGRAER
jgi:hypothetical protein